MIWTEAIRSSGILGLFLLNLGSASLLPFPSEPAIVFSLKFFSPVVVFVVSLLGSICGGVSNYYIGLKGIHSFIAKRNPKREKKAEKWFNKWGPAILLIAPWVPFVGDPLLIVAGTLKVRLKKFLIFSTIGKTLKTFAVVVLGEMLLGYLTTFGI